MKKTALFFAAFFIIAFGQAAFLPWCGILATICGFALFFIAFGDSSTITRFSAGTALFFAAQLVQLHWFVSHPYNYICGVYIFLSLLLGTQFGFIALLATRQNLQKIQYAFLIAGSWTLIEWMRLFYFSGFSFNPVGLAPASNTFLLQGASLFGVYGLSFMVLFINCLVARAFYIKRYSLAIAVIVIPFVLGFMHYTYHEKQLQKDTTTFSALIFNTKLLPEELEIHKSGFNLVQDAMQSWKEIVDTLRPFKNKKYNLVLFPEIVVPFPAESPIFELNQIRELLNIQGPLNAYEREGKYYTTSYAIAQALANELQSPLLIGLEGSEYSKVEKRVVYFNSAYYIPPGEHSMQRYDKLILIPMAESLPYDWARPLAEQYGLFDSFRKGKGTILFHEPPFVIGTSVCYEDCFADASRQNVLKGANILTNLTNDAWYPDSHLGIEHLEHARLRTVETGRPLIRACNFGASGAIDALGRDVKIVPFQNMKQSVEAFVVDVPAYTYSTLYTYWGNIPLITLCALLSIAAVILPILQRGSVRK
jgi:apolipoprotein N-acyltransferase